MEALLTNYIKIMKKIISKLFLALSASIILVACSKDSSSSSSSSIEGKWEYYQEGTVIGGQEVLDLHQHESGCTKDYLEILSGGVIKYYDYDSFVSPCELTIDTGTWSQNGNILTIITQGTSETAEILTLNATTLKIKYVIDTNIEIAVLKRI